MFTVTLLSSLNLVQRDTHRVKFIQAANDYVDYTLKHGDDAAVAKAYRETFGDDAFMLKFGTASTNLDFLSPYVSALEKYEALLRKLGDEPTALKVGEVAKKLRARETSVLEVRRQAAEAQRRQQEQQQQDGPEQAPPPTPTATPSPSPTPTPSPTLTPTP